MVEGTRKGVVRGVIETALVNDTQVDTDDS